MTESRLNDNGEERLFCMTVLNPNMLVSINIVLIAEELVKPNERLMSENYTNHEKHVLELNSEEVTESRLSVIWSKTCA